MLRYRIKPAAPRPASATDMISRRGEREPLLADEVNRFPRSEREAEAEAGGKECRDQGVNNEDTDAVDLTANHPNSSSSLLSSSASMFGPAQWIPLAIASGACASFNGAFAKLTTTELTSALALTLSAVISDNASKALLTTIEAVLRISFFTLNLVFNGIMWAFFTTALSRASSSTRVSIINTSSNFMLTAIIGYMIFSESLPGLWWIGAALLVAGTVIIGQREEDDKERLLVVREGEIDDRAVTESVRRTSPAGLEGVHSCGRSAFNGSRCADGDARDDDYCQDENEALLGEEMDGVDLETAKKTLALLDDEPGSLAKDER